jgi:hypothetical protein
MGDCFHEDHYFGDIVFPSWNIYSGICQCALGSYRSCSCQLQGFMNTNILQWKYDDQTGQTQRVFETPALWFFLYTVGPMTFSTFCLWYAFAWWVKRGEKQAKRHRQTNAEVYRIEKRINHDRGG